jgi:2-aminoadipate transaminase
MISDLQEIFAENIHNMKRSVIRELLKLTHKPGLISFAGGLPSPESFPVDELKSVITKMMDTEPAYALQYGATEGDPLLRSLLLERYRKDGFKIELDNLIITTASQQALDLVSKVFLNIGDYVICGLPTYLGGLSAFNSYGAKMIGVPIDEEGLSAQGVEDAIKELKTQNKKPKFIYTIPDFQNPAGITMSLQRRHELLALAKKYDILIVEDAPYRELRYEGQHIPTIYSLDNTGQVINMGTFSKIFVPGFRIGWVIAHEEIIDKFVIAKQATDLCTPAFNQRIAGRYMEAGYLEPKLEYIIKLYHDKKNAMLRAFEDYMPEEIHWTKPEGGLFLFVTCPEKIDTIKMFEKAIAKNVAYVPGPSFYCDGKGHNTMRINFSFSSIELNIEGTRRLAEVLKEELVRG